MFRNEFFKYICAGLTNMRQFFWFETDFSDGDGFSLFGTCHLVWLSVIALFAIGFVRRYDGANWQMRRRIRHILGVVFPLISIYRDGILTITGHFDVGFLPLHLCSMALWIASLYCFTEQRAVGVLYVLLCVPGAAGALLFPDWNMYPFWNYMHIHAFLSHGLLFAFGLALICSGEVVPTWKEYGIPVVFGAIGFPIIHWINCRLQTNYWFLDVPSDGSPLIFIWNLTGDRWYRLGYFVFCMLVVAVWQWLLRRLYCFCERRQRKRLDI